MNLLLDTDVLLWWLEGGSRLSPNASAAIRRSPRVVVSAATAWEIAIKVAIGKLQVPEPVSLALPANGFEELPIRIEHAEAVAQLPRLHTDPFDRLLVAQAQVEGLTLVTVDDVLSAYPIQTLRA